MDMTARAAALRDLLAQLGVLQDPQLLKDLERALAERAVEGGDQTRKMLDLAQKAERGAQKAELAPEVRDALKNLSFELIKDAEDQQASAQSPDAKGSKASEQGSAGQPTAGSEMSQGNIQFSRDSAAGGSSGVVMLAGQSGQMGDPSAGAGPGQDSSRRGDGHTLELEQALRRETVEASKDVAGENVTTEVRRKTEQGQASTAFTHGASGTFDRSHAAAPPIVPETRRAQVQSYFIRKQ
jgi:hypothetical protein